MSIKVFFAGVFEPHSTNVSQLRAFKDNGCEIFGYNYRMKVNQFGTRTRRDDDMISKVKEIKPNLIVFSKCNQMHYRVVEECNKVGETVLWYMDAKNNYNGELIEKIKRVSYAFTGIEGMLPYFQKHNDNSFFLEQCPDEKMNFMYDNISARKHDVVFIGNISGGTGTHADRKLYKKNVKFTHFSNVHGLRHNKVVNETKINLNFSHTSVPGASVRVFKILASGGFLLTTPWEGMEKIFKIGEDLDVFNSPKELQKKIDFYLDNPSERNRIRLNGNSRVQAYLPKNWAKKILDTVLKK